MFPVMLSGLPCPDCSGETRRAITSSRPVTVWGWRIAAAEPRRVREGEDDHVGRMGAMAGSASGITGTGPVRGVVDAPPPDLDPLGGGRAGVQRALRQYRPGAGHGGRSGGRADQHVVERAGPEPPFGSGGI